MSETPKTPEEEAAEREAWEKSLTAGSLPTWWKPEQGEGADNGAPPAQAPAAPPAQAQGWVPPAAVAPAPPAAMAPPAPMAPPEPMAPPAPMVDSGATVHMDKPVGGPAMPAAPAADQQTMVMGTFPGVQPKAQLEVKSGPDAGVKFMLGSEIAYLGRAKDNQLVVSDPATSRRHARFEMRDHK